MGFFKRLWRYAEKYLFNEQAAAEMRYSDVRGGMAQTNVELRRVGKSRQKEAEKKKKNNNVKPIFNVKDFLQGFKAFQSSSNKLAFNLSKEERAFLTDKDKSTDKQTDVYAKAKMLWYIANDILQTTSLTDEEKEEIKKQYKDDSAFTPVSKKEFKEQRYKDKSVDSKKLDAEYNTYVKMMESRKKLYANPQLAITDEYNKNAKELADYSKQLMSDILSGKGSRDDKVLSKVEQQLNNYYNDLIQQGKAESDAYNYVMQPDEIVAHTRMRNLQKDVENSAMTWWMYTGMYTDEEMTAKTNPKGEQSMYTFAQENMKELNKTDIKAYKQKDDYDADKEITNMFMDLSGNTFQSSDVKDGKQIYKFMDFDDDEDNFMGVKGFNYWRKKGYLDPLLNDKQTLEELAVTYQVLKEKQGEEAAQRWLQERIQHYASEEISGWQQALNAGVGFWEDIVGDAAEIVGGVYGVASNIYYVPANLLQGKDIDETITLAVGQSFDNNISRWGYNLSMSGYWGAEEQEKAMNAFGGEGLSRRDNILDPEKADNFLARYGGSGWGGFVSETARQSSHTMFAAWAGAVLGAGLGRGGAMLGKLFKGTQEEEANL